MPKLYTYNGSSWVEIKGDPGEGLVKSVNGKIDEVVLNSSDVGADPTGSASQALQDAKDYTDSEVSTLDSSLATVAKTGSYNDLTGTDNVVENVGTSADNALARFDGATGKRVQNSGVTLTDQDTLDGVSAVKFDTAGGVTPTAGSLSYNATERVLDMGTGFTGTTIQLGMENVVRVRNTTGATIANGAVVYVNGAQGNRPTVALADADIQAQAMAVIGVATHNIANNSDGLITTEGIVRDLNTNAYNEGDVLYLSGTPGQFTTTPPVSPQTRVDVAVVTRAHNTHGEILVRPQVIVQKSDIGLGNVDNTSDADKPVSTAQQTALNAKQDTLVSGTNIKTINSTSILGSGDIVISGGPPNELSIGTVTTGAPGTDAAASITGTAPEQVLNMTIPAGAPGNDGQAPILLGKYVHSGNLVAQPTAVDLETGVFTCVGHGLTTGNLVRPRFNTIRNTPLLAVFPGGLTATNLTVTVLTPDTFTVGIASFSSVATMDLSAWAFERYVTAVSAFHRVTLAAPVTSCRVVSYGIDGTRYIKSDGLPNGYGTWTPSGVVTDHYGSVSLNTASEVASFLEYSARYVGGLVLLNGRKLTIGVGSATANVIANTPQSNSVSATATVPTGFSAFGFDNGRVFNGNTIEVWDR